jgi:hypothetical protein
VENEYFNLIMYSCYGALILTMHTVLASGENGDPDNDPHETHNFLFHAGRWSLGDAMLFIAFCCNSGLIFTHSTMLGGCFTVLFIIIPFYIFNDSHDNILETSAIAFLPIFFFVFIISAHDTEIKLRHRFLRLSDLGHDLRRHDTLIHSILPPDISRALKTGDIQKLARHHDNVSVLFCSIVGFGKQSSSSHAEVRALFIFSLIFFN